MTVQKRNRFKITVTFPDGREQDYWYPTLDAMDLAAAGFRMQGCVVKS